MKHVLVFGGGSGQIGAAIAAGFASEGWQVTTTQRKATDDGAPIAGQVIYDPFSDDPGISRLPHGRFDAVIWAQGANRNDTIRNFDARSHEAIMQANYLYVAVSLQALLNSGGLAESARLCVISSIWQDIARQDKFSYIVSKAAVRGLVSSAAVDLGADGYLINAILPGALDTPMTRSVLSKTQIDKIAGATPFDRLTAVSDVVDTALYLCSPSNKSITGQMIKVDMGFSNVRLV